jgi:hypothetical protein
MQTNKAVPIQMRKNAKKLTDVYRDNPSDASGIGKNPYRNFFIPLRNFKTIALQSVFCP